MSSAIVAILAAACLAYIAAAFGTRAGAIPAEGARAAPAERKRSALLAILDLEQERSLGKLSQEDYDTLAGEYEAEAVLALRELEAMESRPGEDELEKEIAAVRSRLECGNCGAARAPGSPCPRCGG